MTAERLEVIKNTIKQSVKLTELINRLTNTEIKNGYMICPFHTEKTASMVIDDVKGVYHCFGCGAGGDVFNFVMQYLGLDFYNSIRYIDNLYGLNLLNQRITAASMIMTRKRNKAKELAEKRNQELDELENELCVDFRIANFAVNFLEPLTDLWGYFVNQLPVLQYKLDLIEEERKQIS